MADEIKRVADMLSAPMEEVIAALGTGIARAQRELDRYAIDAQREIDEDPILSEAGLQATFYQIPKAELELTIAIAMEENKKQTPAPGNALLAVGATALKAASIRQVHLQPVNASYTNQFNFNTQASSKIKLTIVPIPPPGADTSVTPRMNQEAILKKAQEKFVQAENARVSFNFNGRSRVWVVLQYVLKGDTTQRLALIVIDDDTGTIIKSE